LGTTTAEAFTQERPPFSAIEDTIRSMYSGQWSILSAPIRILEKPGPCTENFGLSRYWATVFASPKIRARPHKRMISPEPSWSVG
jgi:hypothetical protein